MVTLLDTEQLYANHIAEQVSTCIAGTIMISQKSTAQAFRLKKMKCVTDYQTTTHKELNRSVSVRPRCLLP